MYDIGNPSPPWIKLGHFLFHFTLSLSFWHLRLQKICNYLFAYWFTVDQPMTHIHGSRDRSVVVSVEFSVSKMVPRVCKYSNICAVQLDDEVALYEVIAYRRFNLGDVYSPQARAWCIAGNLQKFHLSPAFLMKEGQRSLCKGYLSSI